MSAPAVDPLALRRGVLAVSVLDDIPLEPARDGVRLAVSWADRATTTVPWFRLHQALAGAGPMSAVGRLRLRDWLRVRQLLAAEGEAVSRRLLPLAMPAGHALHPGRAWVREAVPGGLLTLGLGLRADDDPATDATGLLPAPPALALSPSAVACAGLNDKAWWVPAQQRLDALALLAVHRERRDAKGLITPIGGCDVLTLLGSQLLRKYLAHADGTGLRAVACPMRSRAWFDLAHIDPAFVMAAAAATDEEFRGVDRPLLVTVDEVTVADSATWERFAHMGLREPAAPDPSLRRLHYR